MSEKDEECYACQRGIGVIRSVRACLGYCDECNRPVNSIDNLHVHEGKRLCDSCAKKAGHFEEIL